MKKLFAWIKKLVAIGAAVSTNEKTKEKLEAYQKAIAEIDAERNAGDR